MHQAGPYIELTHADGRVAVSGDLDAVEAYLDPRVVRNKPGPAPSRTPAKWRRWIDLFVAEQKAAKRSPATIHMRTMHLRTFARHRPDSDPLTITRDDLIADLGRAGLSPWTVRSIRSTFRAFFAMLQEQGYRSDDPAAKLPKVSTPRSKPRPCPDEVVRAAFASVEDPKVLLALRIAVETGMRRAEVAGLRRDQIEGRPGLYSLRIVGKGGHERIVPIDDHLAAELLAVRTVHIFPEPFGGGSITPERLGKVVAEALAGKWTMHTLRHRFATKAYQGSLDLRAVQELLGHSSPVTTAIYTAVGDDSMRSAAAAARLTFDDCESR